MRGAWERLTGCDRAGKGQSRRIRICIVLRMGRAVARGRAEPRGRRGRTLSSGWVRSSGHFSRRRARSGHRDTLADGGLG